MTLKVQTQYQAVFSAIILVQVSAACSIIGTVDEDRVGICWWFHISCGLDGTAESIFCTFHKIASSAAMRMDLYASGQYMHSFHINQLCSDNGEITIGYF